MARIDDVETGGFSFIWTIHNFSYCVPKNNERIDSPRFVLNTNNQEKCFLRLYPQGYHNSKVVVGFIKEDSSIQLPTTYVLSLRTVGGFYKKIADVKMEFTVTGFGHSVGQKEILKKGTDAFLDNDSLTIRWRVITVDGNILESKQCYARTEVIVERVSCMWNLRTLSDLKTKELDTKTLTNMPDIASFTMNVTSTIGILGEDKFKMIIKRKNADKLCFSTCAISLLDTGKVIQSVYNEHWFEISFGEQIWTIPFAPKISFLTNPKQNSTIYLHCEFAASFGKEHSTIDKIEYGINGVSPFMYSKPTLDSDHLSSWKDNLRSFYFEGKFSDVSIQTPSKKFPVHKAMLCAQSTVFEAMFENDMKENRTGIVEIEDLEDDIVSRMLLFVYTCTVEDLDWEIASKLYFAADKYKLTTLLNKCSVFLKDNLSTSNACKCLVLADMHQDQDLKSFAQDFIIEHSNHIFPSDEWKQLMKEKCNLAAEMMHVMIMRNLKV